MKKITIVVGLILIFSSLSAGDYMFIETHNASVDLISGTQTGDSWLDVSDLTVASCNGFTPTSGTTTSVTSTNGGTYLVKYSVSFSASYSCDWTFAVDAAGTNYHEISRRIGGSSDVGNASGSGLITLSSSQSVKLKVKPSVDADEFTPVDVQLVLVELRESTTAQEYASISINATVSSFTVGTSYTTFTGLSQRDVSDNWSAASGVLTCNSADAAGTYLAIFSFSGKAQNEVLTDIGISVNDADPSAILTQRVFGKIGDIGNVSGCGIITVANGNTVRLKGKAGSSKKFDIYFSNVTLVKIVDDQDAPYASMNIESTTSSFSVGTTWTKVTNGLADDLTDGTYWEFSDNSLKPVGVSGGYYLVNYYYSLTGGSESSENIIVDGDIGVNSNTEQLDLAIKRKLDKKDGVDIGAAAATGIIFIDEAADDISMLLRAPDGANDLIVRSANISIVRIDKVGDATLPVELSAFTAQFNSGNAELLWVTQSEEDNIGWNIYRNNDSVFPETDPINSELITGYGTTTQPHVYTYTDNSLINIEEGTYWYWLENIDLGGQTNSYGPAVLEVTTSQPPSSGEDIEYDGIYNVRRSPCNAENGVNVSFNINKTSSVSLDIYNIKGQHVRTLFDGYSAGEQSCHWDAQDSSGKLQSSGVYLFVLNVDGKNYDTQKVIMMK